MTKTSMVPVFYTKYSTSAGWHLTITGAGECRLTNVGIVKETIHLPNTCIYLIFTLERVCLTTYCVDIKYRT